MNRLKRKQLWLGIGCLLLVAGGAAAWVFWLASDDGHYMDSPFVKVEPTFPRIIPIEEPPWSNPSEMARYRREYYTIQRYLASEGAISRASEKERLAVQAGIKQNYPKAYKLAREILKQKPESIPARFVLADVFFSGENLLPKALFQIRKARRLLEQRGQENPKDADAREWYIRVLHLEYQILNYLDRSEEQIRVTEVLGQVYQELPWLQFWPLMKLKRFAEARKRIDQMEKTGRWKRFSLNNRYVLEVECRRRQEAFRLGQEMVKIERSSPVLWSNFSIAALGSFQLAEAERALKESVRLSDAGLRDFNGSPSLALSHFYLQAGSFAKAWPALQKAKIERDLREPHTLELDQGRMARGCALMLLALGRAEEALRFARQAHDRPDRLGQLSTDASRAALSNKLVLWTVLQARIEQLREADAASSVLGNLLPDMDRKSLEFEAWTLKQQMVKLLRDLSDRNEFRPYLGGSADLDSLMTGGLVRILPPAIATVAIREGRKADKGISGATPYFDAFEAEAALARGDYEEALSLARKALAKLPVQEEKLLRARVAAVAAQAAWKLDRNGESIQLLDEVLRDFPQVLRMVGMALPVRITDDGSSLARQFADALRKSPRFREADNGFGISIRVQGGRLRFAMSRLGKKVHFQDSVLVKKDADDVLEAALKTFYQKMMSPKLTLTDADINSLDSSAAGSRAHHDARRHLKKS